MRRYTDGRQASHAVAKHVPWNLFERLVMNLPRHVLWERYVVTNAAVPASSPTVDRTVVGIAPHISDNSCAEVTRNSVTAIRTSYAAIVDKRDALPNHVSVLVGEVVALTSHIGPVIVFAPRRDFLVHQDQRTFSRNTVGRFGRLPKIHAALSSTRRGEVGARERPQFSSVCKVIKIYTLCEP